MQRILYYINETTSEFCQSWHMLIAACVLWLQAKSAIDRAAVTDASPQRQLEKV